MAGADVAHRSVSMNLAGVSRPTRRQLIKTNRNL